MNAFMFIDYTGVIVTWWLLELLQFPSIRTTSSIAAVDPREDLDARAVLHGDVARASVDSSC